MRMARKFEAQWTSNLAQERSSYSKGSKKFFCEIFKTAAAAEAQQPFSRAGKKFGNKSAIPTGKLSSNKMNWVARHLVKRPLNWALRRILEQLDRLSSFFKYVWDKNKRNDLRSSCTQAVASSYPSKAKVIFIPIKRIVLMNNYYTCINCSLLRS